MKINQIELYKEFLLYISPIIKNPSFQPLRKFYQHRKHTVYTHVINVAFFCYCYAIKHPKIEKDVLIRGALLHDYFLYDWHVKGGHKGLHGFNHPKIATHLASNKWPLSKKEKNIIRSHMWPLTFFHPPLSKEAWIVCFMDKKAAIYEMWRHRHPRYQ